MEQLSKKLNRGVKGQGLPTFLALGYAYLNISLPQSHVMRAASVKSWGGGGDEGVPGVAGRWEVTAAAQRSHGSIV